VFRNMVESEQSRFSLLIMSSYTASKLLLMWLSHDIQKASGLRARNPLIHVEFR
jgi:hypothetical protein